VTAEANGRQKRVLFLSCASHQTKLFNFLRNALPSGVSATITNSNLLPFTPRFWFALFGERPSRQTVDPIIALDYQKYLVNRSAFRRPFDGIVEWLWRFVASIYVVLFRRRLQRDNVGLLVVWGGFQLPIAAALAAAREAGIATLFCENGYLPRTIVMDPKGINAGNSLMGKPAAFYQAINMPEETGKDLFGTSLVARPLRGGATASENVTLPARLVFLPLQVHDDSQILLYSPHFPDMPSVIRFCVAGVAAYNRLSGTELKLVVKEHPSDHGRVDYSDLYREFSDVVFTKLANTQNLIGKSEVVITVNSTVGIEAMLQLKPVITLGDAFYAVPGLVTPCGANDDLGAALQHVLEMPVDRDLAEHFLYFLRHDYLVPLDRNNLAASDPAPAVARIVEALR
jgi:capsular polysaccharide export protein